MRIREARRRDAMALVALQRSVLAEDRWFIRTEAEAPSLEDVERDLPRYRDSDNSVWLVAEDGAQVCGHLMLTGGVWVRTRHEASFIVMVAASHRGRGVGRALVQQAVQWATACPMLQRVGLNVMSDNAAAIGLYEALGFAEEGRRTGHMADPERGEVWMGLALESAERD